MKKARIAVVALAVLMLFAAVSCKEPHVHEFSKEWMSDAKNHWHECECGEKTDVAEHSFEVVKEGENLVKKCTVCEYTSDEELKDSAIAGTAGELEAALKGTAKVIYIGADFEVPSELEVSGDVEINLNGKTVTGKGCRVFLVKGNAVISGKGTITVSEGIKDASSVIRLGFNADKETNVSLSVGKDVVVSSDYSYGISVFGVKTNETLVVDGTVTTKGVPAISGLGTDHEGTKITINGTVATEGDNAIYHPQVGELVINGTVDGGIEMKAGSLKLGKDAVVKGGTFAKHNSVNNNGCSTSGYAIAAVNNNNGYATGVKIDIENGFVYGYVEIVDDVKPETFKTEQTPVSISLSGGTYTVKPADAYIKDGFEAKQLSENSWTIVSK